MTKTNHDLMTRDEIAALMGIAPESVRSTLRRNGITEQRGYLRDAVYELIRRRTESSHQFPRCDD